MCMKTTLPPMARHVFDRLFDGKDSRISEFSSLTSDPGAPPQRTHPDDRFGEQVGFGPEGCRMSDCRIK